MLRRSVVAFPRYDKDYDEVKYLQRRVLPMPKWQTMLNVRTPDMVLKFKDVGPDTDRVWISLGEKMRHRRVGRDTDRKDLRYYWRPLPSGIQQLYTNPARRARSRIEGDTAPRLHPKANEQGLAFEQGNRNKYAGLDKKYGALHAAPLPMDWEYRVY
jgi:hypothetical protein